MEDRGLYIKPTVFSEVTDTMRIAREEVVGLQAKPRPMGPGAEQGRRERWALHTWGLLRGSVSQGDFVRGAYFCVWCILFPFHWGP